MHNQIELWFLILSLAFPRLALLGAYLSGSGMPPHVGVPFWLCVLGSIFFARILVTVFVGMNMGTDSPWFWAHAILCVIGTTFEWLRANKNENSKD